MKISRSYILSRVRDLFFPTIYILLIYVGMLLRLHFSTGGQTISFFIDIPWIILGGIELIITSTLFYLLLPAKRVSKYIVASSIVFLYSILTFYHLRTKSPFDFSIAILNIGELIDPTSFQTIEGMFKLKDIVTMTIVTVTPWFIFIFDKSDPIKFKPIHRYVFIPTLMFVSITVSLIIPVHFNELSNFFRSGVSYFGPPPEEFRISSADIINGIKQRKRTDNFKSPLKDKNKKIENIFIIFMESFNARFVDKKSKNGKEFTPYFNQLKKKGLYYSNFYSASVQTAKGHFTTLCSIIPHTRLKEMTSLKNLDLNCLPRILTGLGMKTFAFQAFSNKDFDNMANFQTKNGISKYLAMTSDFITREEEENYSWGWGIQDDILYKKTFEYLKREKLTNKLFVTLSPISNHMKFNKVPVKLRYMYKEPKNTLQNYANTIYLMDLFLRRFFLELEESKMDQNSAVILLGDHGFPMGEHDNFTPENKAYEENFRTPLLILLPESWMKGIDKRVVSQIDIAPTILDLLDAGKIENEFMGVSLFKNIDRYAVLVQPYDGRYIGVVDRNYKYLYHVSTERSFIYDLSIDQMEQDNIFEKSKRDYSTTIRSIFLNDAILEHLSKREN